MRSVAHVCSACAVCVCCYSVPSIATSMARFKGVKPPCFAMPLPMYWQWLLGNVLFMLWFSLTLHHSWVTALPVYKRDIGSIEVPPPEILRFLRRFGYLEANPSDSEALYHESAIVEAIKNVQKYGALNQTGKLDDKTLNLFSTPRCGVPDIEGVPYYLVAATTQSGFIGQRKRAKRFVIGARPWSKRHIRYFIANWSLKIPAVQIERDIARALALWSRYSALQFERANDTSADIIIGFGSRYHGDNYPFDGPGNILAHAYYPYELGSWGGDLHFDEDEDWKENATDLAQGVDFYAVALHELGHSLGLAHSPIYDSIMFPYYKGPEHTMLSSDDTYAMYEMYLNKQLEDDNELSEELTSNEIFETEAETSTALPKWSTTTLPTQITDFTPTFQGDFETITQHKSRYAFITPPKEITVSSLPTLAPVTQSLWSSTRGKKFTILVAPNICEGKFDAVTMANGSVHIFKRHYVWKLTERYTIAQGYPRRIHDVLPFLPQHVQQIDAAYNRYDGAVVIFAGSFVWIYNGMSAIENSPKPLTNYIGNATAMTKIDAAIMWPKNNYTYLFAGTKFWRYNDRLQLLDIDYPKPLSRWPGIPPHLDAATTLPNGKTYFFKNNIYWLYNNTQLRPERGYPRRASTAWLGCVTPIKPTLRNFNTTVSFIAASSSAAAPTLASNYPIVDLLSSS